jgi:hypothetical protein
MNKRKLRRIEMSTSGRPTGPAEEEDRGVGAAFMGLIRNPSKKYNENSARQLPVIYVEALQRYLASTSQASMMVTATSSPFSQFNSLKVKWMSNGETSESNV